ncbi:MAG: hypothetical protein ACI4TT_04020 [Christensenellales bacterium]
MLVLAKNCDSLLTKQSCQKFGENAKILQLSIKFVVLLIMAGGGALPEWAGAIAKRLQGMAHAQPPPKFQKRFI